MNRKECLKIMVRCVAFVVVFSMLFGNATDLLMRHDDESNEIHAFYSEPEDTIDVLYVGSSPLLRGVSPMVMWQEHGFTVLLVTHDVSEAVAMADRVLLIEEKKIGLDLSVDIPRPRRTGSAKLAELEAEVLDRVMKRGDSERAPRLFSHG